MSDCPAPQHDWKQAYAQLSVADEGPATIGVEDLERLAICAYMLGRDEPSADCWARAHAGWLQRRDVGRAARCAFWLVLDVLTRGAEARASGWLTRTKRLLDEQPECAEQGLLQALIARTHVRQGDIDSALQAASRAIDLSRRYDDSELHVFSRLSLAQVMARRGDRDAAAGLFDEIMVAVTLGDVSPVAVGVVYCAVIEGCFAALDLGRAREWTEALSGWCEAQPDLVADAPPASPFKYPIGAAFYQLAEMHRLRGAFERADAATAGPVRTATYRSRGLPCCDWRRVSDPPRSQPSTGCSASRTPRPGARRSLPPVPKS